MATVFARLCTLAVLGLLVLSPSALADDPAAKQPSGDRPEAPKTSGGAAAPANLSGRLTTHDGIPLLELWGTRDEAAFAHGYLTAPHIVALIDEYVLDPSIVPNPTMYESMLIPSVRRLFDWDDATERELNALLAGMQTRLGAAGVRSKKLDRELRVEDLMVANTLADWLGLFCSTFSAWGALTTDGETLTARNLDFPWTPTMARSQLVVIYRATGKGHAWMGVTWPGLIGVYTGMNDAGVTMLIHDATGLPASQNTGFRPRSLILREALEGAAVATWRADVHRVFARNRVMVGNNVHVSGPKSGSSPPAIVFEYDGNRSEDGVSARLPGADLADAIWCTNHMCVRRSPDDAGRGSAARFGVLEAGLRGVKNDPTRLDVAAAQKLLDQVRRPNTVHSVCLRPAGRTMYVRIAALGEKWVEIHFAD